MKKQKFKQIKGKKKLNKNKNQIKVKKIKKLKK